MSGGMFRRSVRVWLAALVAIAAASCSHKDLCYDHSHIVELNVIFDWSEAPDATPRTMVLQLFELDGSHYNRYEFGSTKGGIIRVRAGAYRMLFVPQRRYGEHGRERFALRGVRGDDGRPGSCSLPSDARRRRLVPAMRRRSRCGSLRSRCGPGIPGRWSWPAVRRISR